MNSLQKAFIDKFKEHHKYISRIWSRKVDPDEIMQNTYIALGKNKYKVEKEENYIKATIFKLILNEIRRNKRYVNYAEIEDNFWVTENTPEDNVRVIQLRDKIDKRISGDKKVDKILRMKLLHLMSDEEIAKSLDMTVVQAQAHVKVNKFRGKLDYLKDLL